MDTRCNCAYSGTSPSNPGAMVKNGFLIHTYNGPHTCNYLPGDVIQTGVVRGRVSIPDQNSSNHLGLW